MQHDEPDIMHLVFLAGEQRYSCGWSSYALLRDNVQHFAEHGTASERFAALHGLEQAVTSGHSSVEASRLRGEVLGATFVLGGVVMDDAAISLRTRAIMTASACLPEVRGTVQASQVGWELPVAADSSSNLLEHAKPFIRAVLAVTAAAVDGDAVQVWREGDPPRFARA
jgi:hypothetical protein